MIVIVNKIKNNMNASILLIDTLNHKIFQTVSNLISGALWADTYDYVLFILYGCHA